jgi:hypothetical protein
VRDGNNYSIFYSYNPVMDPNKQSRLFLNSCEASIATNCLWLTSITPAFYIDVTD